MPHVGSSSRLFLQTTVDISRRVLVTTTTCVDAVGRRVILHGIVRSLTRGVVAATIEATTSVAHRVIIRRISQDGLARPIGVVVKQATTLTSAPIHLSTCRMDCHQDRMAEMSQWKTGEGFAIEKMRTCLSIVRISQRCASRCSTHIRPHPHCCKDSSMGTWLVCRIQIRCQVWRLV